MKEPSKIIAYGTDAEGEEFAMEINDWDVRMQNDKAYENEREWYKPNGPIRTYKMGDEKR